MFFFYRTRTPPADKQAYIQFILNILAPPSYLSLISVVKNKSI